MKKPRIFFVSHPHNEPGYRASNPGARISVAWNTTTKHHRKLIKRYGQYLKNGVLSEADLYFWGEYEAPSDCVLMNQKAAPKAIHDVLHPVRGSVPVLTNAQNTDPYVFGEHFKNICCGIKNKKYQNGDVIIFGHRNGDAFMFDTVLVVDRKAPINHLRTRTQYYKVSIEPLNQAYKTANKPKGPVEYYYKGTSFLEDQKVFSFIPCTLDFPTNKSMPSLNLVRFGSTAHAAAVTFTEERWRMILNAVISLGWEIGTYIEKV
jgi:hypothetical protein